MTQYAKFETRSAWLGNPFGESYARRIFGDAAIDALPRYSRGKSTGKLKAEIAWVRCTEGGWISLGRDVMREEAVGRVERRAGQTVLVVLRSRDAGNIATHGDIQYSGLLDQA